MRVCGMSINVNIYKTLKHNITFQKKKGTMINGIIETGENRAIGDILNEIFKLNMPNY